MSEKQINSSTVNIPSITMTQQSNNPATIASKWQLFIKDSLLKLINPSGTVKIVVDEDSTQTLSNKTLDASTVLPASGVAPGSYTLLSATIGADGRITSAANGSSTSIPGLCQGRLTLTSGTPVTTSDVTGAGTLYFTPFKGNQVSLHDGSVWATYTFTERSLALSLTAANVYDVFLYDNAGTLTLETLIWTNPTTRATAIVLQDGIYVKSGDTTRRYLGSIYASGSNTTEDSVLKRFVWNYYNRVPRKLRMIDTTDSWTYSTATFRSWNNSATNRVEAVVGVSEEMLYLRFAGFVGIVSSAAGVFGIGVDSTSVNSSEPNGFAQNASAISAITVPIEAIYNVIPTVGYHYYQALERGNGSGTTTFYGDNGAAGIIQSGMTGWVTG